MAALLDLLCPSRCDGCGRAAPPPWCDTCAAAAPPAVRPCRWCAGDLDGRHACWSPSPPVDALVALHDWTGPVAAAAYRAKAVGRREVLRSAGRRLAAPVADVLAAGAPPAVDDGLGPPTVVPVAADRRRVRSRGADHALELASGRAAGLGVPCTRLLRPVGRQPDRGGGRADAPVGRTRAVGTAPASVVLVDDVVTTGATLAAAAVVLRGAGAVRVLAAVVGRAGVRPLGGGDGSPSPVDVR